MDGFWTIHELKIRNLKLWGQDFNLQILN